MGKRFTSHLTEWSDPYAVEAARDVKSLLEHPGWDALRDALESRERQLRTELIGKKPTDVAAEYATTIGEMKALRSLPEIAEGVVENGRTVEQALREQEEAA